MTTPTTTQSTFSRQCDFIRKVALLIVGMAAMAGLLGWGTKAISLIVYHNDDKENLRFLQNSRNGPDKGNPKNCMSKSGYPVPCHDENGNGDNDFEGLSKLDPWDPRLPNKADVTVYVGLKPRAKSISHTLAKVVSLSMNDFSDSIEFFLPQDFDDEENMNSSHVPWDSGGSGAGSAGGGNQNQGSATGGGSGGGGGNQNQGSTTGGGGGGGGDGQRRNEKNRHSNQPHRFMADIFTESGSKNSYDLYYSRRKAKLLYRGEYRWWWKYTFVYNCFWGGTYDPVADSWGLGENMTALLHTHGETVRTRLALVEGDPRIRLTTNDPRIDEDMADSSSSMDDGKVIVNGDTDGEAVKASDPSYLQPLNSSVWNWQRYTGLVLLLSVSLSAMCLVQLSATRQRKRIRKQVWSNLASEEGVKDLLRSGWIVKGNRMEIFDKSKLGYQEDSSVLLGGFEQKEPIGSEITYKVSREGSTKTPETRRTSSHTFIYPSSQTNLSSSAQQLEEGEKDTSPLDQEINN